MFVCLTGNPNSGKTQLLELLYEDGFTVFNVDEYVREIYKVNQIGYILITQHFGKEYTLPDRVDTKKLGTLILEDKFQCEKLKVIIWPLIKSKLHWLKNRFPNCVVEMAIYKTNPLYFYNIFDYIIEIKRDVNTKNSKDRYNAFYANNHECYKPNVTIKNNSDLLIAYDELKEVVEIINMLEQKSSDTY